MSSQEYPNWYAKQIEALELFHAEKAKLLGENAPRRCTDKSVDKQIDKEETK